VIGFLNPWLLLGIAAVGVPVLIHLLNRYRFRETDWAMMRFLIPATRIRSRQIKVQDVLLLVLRCLAVFLVMLALARPTIRPEGSSWPLGETRAGAVIVLDASFSMHHAAGMPGTARASGNLAAARTRFERALEQVREISATLKPGDPVTLVLVGSRVRVLLRNAPFDAERFGKELADLARSGPMPERLNLDTLPGLLLPLVKELKAVRREVYLVTDAQASQWRSPPAEGRPALTGVEEAKEHRAVSVGSEMRELAEAAHGVFLLPVGGVEAENLAVTRLELASGVLRRGAMARYAVTVRNFGARPKDGATVVCRLDGTTVDERSLGFLAPGEAKTVSMFVPLQRPGALRVSAHLGADPLELDNARYAVAEVRERVSVLCVDGDPSGEPFEGAADFVVAALSTGEFDPAEESLAVRSVPWLALPSESIADHDVVILVDVPDVPEAQVEALYDLVRGGGGLIVFVGDNTKPHTWNEKMRVGRESLLPADLVEVVEGRFASGGLTPLDPSFPRHPLCLALRSLPLDLVSEARFRRHMSVRAHPEAEAVLKLAGKGDPLLLEKRVGRGRVLLFTSTADRDWNNIVINPVFPILLQQAVAYLTRAQHERPLTVGQPIVVHVPGVAEGQAPSEVRPALAGLGERAEVTFEAPSGKAHVRPTSRRQGGAVAVLARADEPGFHRATHDVRAPAIPVAVNVDTGESDVRGLTAEELAATARDLRLRVVAPGASVVAAIREGRTGRELWSVLLFAGVLAVVAEALLARHISARKRRPEEPAESETRSSEAMVAAEVKR